MGGGGETGALFHTDTHTIPPPPNTSTALIFSGLGVYLISLCLYVLHKCGNVAHCTVAVYALWMTGWHEAPEMQSATNKQASELYVCNDCPYVFCTLCLS